MSAAIAMWLADPLEQDVQLALERIARTEDVKKIAVMPDVHLASAVCIGTVTATTHRLLPEAVGGDIGCGMSALRFAAPASILDSERHAAAVLAGLYRAVPFIKHGVRAASALPAELQAWPLSAAPLEKLKPREARLQLGTIGRGNHFLELQRDEEDGLWLMVHSGSRAMGPAIREHHLRVAASDRGVRFLDARDARGAHYLADVAWARAYARENRAHMTLRVVELLHALFGVEPERATHIDCDHNHVQLEVHEGEPLWVHRKGALHAGEGLPAVIPGSMGSASFHVTGRGLPEALCSSSHGAGRALSRTDARRRITRKQLLGEVEGVWFDHRLTDRLREEAPAAYKDIGRVMRAQRALTRVSRRLQPVLVYKGA